MRPRSFPLLLNRITTDAWRTDLRGGLQAAAVALPMGLAFGVVSGAGPVAGIYGAVWTGLCAALFGGTPTQISGPTGPIAIVMASIFVQFGDRPGAAVGIIVLAGLMQLAFGTLRFGRYINLVPYPVISGFSAGVGCIIIVMQMNPLLGQASVTDTISAVRALPTSMANANWLTVAIAVSCLAACQWLPEQARRFVPVHLTVLLAATTLTGGLDLPRLAAPATLLPSLSFPPITALPWQDMWVAATVLALIGSLDSLVTSIAADTATQRFHDSDKELLGQGIGNIVAGLLGALPGAGSTFRTMANIRGGGRTPLSAVIHALFLLALLLSAGRLIAFIPSAVLAGILIYIGLGIIDWGYIKRFPFAPRGGVAIMVVVWLVAVFVNVVTAVALGIVLASLGFVKRMADLQLAAVQVGSSLEQVEHFTAEERAAYDASDGATLLIRLAGPLTFGAANGLTKRVANTEKFRTLLLEFVGVPHIDESAVVALEGIIRRAHANRQTVVLVGLNSTIVRAFVRLGLLPLIKHCRRFKRRVDALRYAAENATRRSLR